jgi:hypothetical protein
MKRALAYRYCQQEHRQVSKINGILITPMMDRDYVKFYSIHAVGSFVKGKLEPNDLDLLIHLEGLGKGTKLSEGGILDKEYKRRYGMHVVVNSERHAYKWLTRGMRHIHRLNAYEEETIFYVKVEIYPKFELNDPVLIIDNYIPN